jgi:hypothetical protein
MPIKKRRGARRGPWRSESKRRWIAGLPCIICYSPDTQAAHTSHNGMSSKGPDTDLVPLCCINSDHHGQYDGRKKLPNGRVGRAAFELFYGVWMGVAAKGYHQRWLAETGQPLERAK